MLHLYAQYCYLKIPRILILIPLILIESTSSSSTALANNRARITEIHQPSPKIRYSSVGPFRVHTGRPLYWRFLFSISIHIHTHTHANYIKNSLSDYELRFQARHIGTCTQVVLAYCACAFYGWGATYINIIGMAAMTWNSTSVMHDGVVAGVKKVISILHSKAKGSVPQL